MTSRGTKHTKDMNNHEIIIQYLEDGKWHCMANPTFFMKDDRKRISEINQKYERGEIDFRIEGKPCDKRCGITHKGGIYMRRIMPRIEPPIAQGINHAESVETPYKSIFEAKNEATRQLIPIKGILDSRTEQVIFKAEKAIDMLQYKLLL